MAELGLSQAELARRVGLSQPAIFALIHKNKTGSKSLHQIARELNTTPAWLMGETDDPDAVEPDEFQLSFEERTWVAGLRGLDPRDREAVLRIVRSLPSAPPPTLPTLHSQRDSFTPRGTEDRL